MKTKFASALLLAASLSVAGAAIAASYSESSTIKAIDAKAMTVTLADGTIYALPKGFDLTAFTLGEKVVVTWEMMGSGRLIDKMVAG